MFGPATTVKIRCTVPSLSSGAKTTFTGFVLELLTLPGGLLPSVGSVTVHAQPNETSLADNVGQLRIL